VSRLELIAFRASGPFYFDIGAIPKIEKEPLCSNTSFGSNLNPFIQNYYENLLFEQGKSIIRY